MNYDNEDYSPNRLSMRKRENKRGEILFEYPYGSNVKLHHIYQYIPKLLEKSIGKSFSKVFSKFCEKYPENIGGLNTREEFKSHFTEYNSYGFRGQKQGDFFIDKQGRIQHMIKPYKNGKKNKKEYYVDTPVYYYKLNKSFLYNHPIFASGVYRIIGDYLYGFCIEEEKIPENIYLKIYLLLDKHYPKLRDMLIEDGYNFYYSYNFSCDLINNLFIKKCDTETITVKTTDNDYIKYIKEQNDAKKRKYREYLKEREERYEEALRKINELKEKEKKQNIIDRDRLGFDNMSFKKEKAE